MAVSYTHLDVYKRQPYKKELSGTNAFLMGSDMALCAILNLKEHGGRQEKLYLTKAAELETRETQRKDYRIFCMGHQTSESLYHLYYGEHTILPENIEVYSIPPVSYTHLDVYKRQAMS